MINISFLIEVDVNL